MSEGEASTQPQQRAMCCLAPAVATRHVWMLWDITGPGAVAEALAPHSPALLLLSIELLFGVCAGGPSGCLALSQ